MVIVHRWYKHSVNILAKKLNDSTCIRTGGKDPGMRS